MQHGLVYDYSECHVHFHAYCQSLFTGKERDTESGLDYFGARYYASSTGRFMSPDRSAKIEPVPYSKLDNPQSLNLYSYTLNNPLSNVDTDGHACSGILGNTGSGFCTRATEYGKIDGNATVRSQTRFFAAASAVSSALADVDAPGSSLIGGISGQTASFLEGVGQKLEAFNEGEAHLIASGNLSGPGLDQQLVHNEQTVVQGQLDGLQQSNPDAYNQTISQINGALNPGSNTSAGFASTRFPTDAAYAGPAFRGNPAAFLEYAKGLIDQAEEAGTYVETNYGIVYRVGQTYLVVKDQILTSFVPNAEAGRGIVTSYLAHGGK